MQRWRLIVAMWLVACVVVSAVLVAPVIEWATYQLRISAGYPSPLSYRAAHLVEDFELKSMSLMELQIHQNRLMEIQDMKTAIATVCQVDSCDVHGRGDVVAPYPLTVEAVEAQLLYVDQLRAASPLGREDEWPLAHQYLHANFATFPNQLAYIAALKAAGNAQPLTTSTPVAVSSSSQFTIIVQITRSIANSVLWVSRQLYFFALRVHTYLPALRSPSSSTKTNWSVLWGDSVGSSCCGSSTAIAAATPTDGSIGGAICVHRRLHLDLCANISHGSDCLLLSVRHMLDAHVVVPMHETAVLINNLVTIVVLMLCFYLVQKAARMSIASAKLRKFAESSAATAPKMPQVVDSGTQFTHRGPRPTSSTTTATSTTASPRHLNDSSRSPLAMSETIAPQSLALSRSTTDEELDGSGHKVLASTTRPPTTTSTIAASLSPPPTMPTALVSSSSTGTSASTAVTTHQPVDAVDDEEDVHFPTSPSESIPRSSLEARHRMFSSRRQWAVVYTFMGLLVMIAIPVGALLIESLGMADSVAGYLLAACDGILSGIMWIVWGFKSVMGWSPTVSFTAAKTTLSSLLEGITPSSFWGGGGKGAGSSSGGASAIPTLINAGEFLFLPRLYPKFDAQGTPALPRPSSNIIAPVIASVMFLNVGAMGCYKLSKWLFEMAESELADQYVERVNIEVRNARQHAEQSIARSRSPNRRSSSPPPTPPRAGSVPRLQLRHASS